MSWALHPATPYSKISSTPTLSSSRRCAARCHHRPHQQSQRHGNHRARKPTIHPEKRKRKSRYLRQCHQARLQKQKSNHALERHHHTQINNPRYLTISPSNYFETIKQMNIEDYRAYCLSLGTDVEERLPFTAFKSAQGVLAFYVHGHIFSFLDCDNYCIITLKCQPERIEEPESAIHLHLQTIQPSAKTLDRHRRHHRFRPTATTTHPQLLPNSKSQV